MLTNHKTVAFCVLNDWDNLGLFLTDLGISKNRQKNLIANKKYLNKKLFSREAVELPIDLINVNLVSPKYIGPKIEKIEDNKLFLALSKPTKVHSLPLNYSESDNILSFIRMDEKNAEIFFINKYSYEKGLLYRLDYETSGLILLAKDELFYNSFRNKIKKNKYYLAVVQGDIKNDFSYAHHISYFGEKGAIGKVTAEATKNAHLEGKKIAFDQKNNQSLVLIKLSEGMRHQIRIQLSHEGNPIIGDPIYGLVKSTRMFLHSFCYEFFYNNKEHQVLDFHFNELEIIFNGDGILKMAHEALLSFKSSHF